MMRQKQSGIRMLAACLLVGALLLAASVDAGHVCGALRASHETPADASQAQASAGYCPICALAQPATAGNAAVSLAPAMHVTSAPRVAAPEHHSFQGLFALNVRPPPA